MWVFKDYWCTKLILGLGPVRPINYVNKINSLHFSLILWCKVLKWKLIN